MGLAGHNLELHSVSTYNEAPWYVWDLLSKVRGWGIVLVRRRT